MPTEIEIMSALALNAVPGVGPVTYRKLVEAFGGADKVFGRKRSELATVKGLRAEAADAILATDPEKAGAAEIDKIRKAGVSVTFIGAPEYPVNLAQIYDPPPVLYYTGELRDTDPIAVAVVGSRDPTDQAIAATARITGDMARAGVTIVSGMARGIDTAAHLAAIDNGGRTIAVLGCGVDVIYPPENAGLYARIRSNGAVVSIFPMGTRPDRMNFPIRNRVISGLSLGVVVMQATSPDSGSLITARQALEQGREVFAAPGQAGSPSARGANQLIKRGEAKLIDGAEDVLSEILPQLKIKGDPKNVGKERVEPPLPKMTDSEAKTFNIVGDTPQHVDIIAKKCNIPIHEIAAILLSLELKGVIKQLPGMNYTRISRP